MGLREIYDHPSFDKGGSNKSSGSSERHEVKEPNEDGGEIGKTIEVRDSTHRSSQEKISSKEDRSTPEVNQRDHEDKVSPGRERIDKNPVQKEKPLGSSEKHDRNPNSNSAKIAERTNYILRKGYLENRDQVNNIIRCGNSSCNSFGPPNQGKELKNILKEILIKLAIAAGKAGLGKPTNPYVSSGTAMLKATTSGNDDADLEQNYLELEMFIFKNENPDIIKKYNEFHLDRFPDLKSPDEVNKDQMKQRNDYFDYNIY